MGNCENLSALLAQLSQAHMGHPLKCHDMMGLRSLWQAIYRIRTAATGTGTGNIRFRQCSGLRRPDPWHYQDYSLFLRASTGIQPASFIQYLTVSWWGLGPTILTAWFSSLWFSLRSAAVMPTPSSTACSSLAWGGEGEPGRSEERQVGAEGTPSPWMLKWARQQAASAPTVGCGATRFCSALPPPTSRSP